MGCLAGQEFDGEYLFKNNSGEMRWVRSRGHPRFDSSGKIAEIYGTFQDITDSVKKDYESKLLSERLSLALEAASIGIWEYQHSSKTIVIDSQVQKILNTDQETWDLESWLQLLGQEDRDQFIQSLEQAHKDDSYHESFWLTCPDGKKRHLIFSGKLVSLQNGVTEVLGACRDITLETEQEQGLITAKNEAIRASQAKSMFLSNMSHEIRTPMNGVIGFVNLLLETSLNGEQKNYLSLMKDSSESLLSLINDILDYSKIESGMMSLSPESTNLVDLLNQFRQIFGPSLASKDVEFIIDADNLDGDLLIDRLKFRQVINNLIGNAIKFTHKGSITLKVRQNSQEKKLFLEVKDTGIGIPAARVAKIFSPLTNWMTPLPKNTVGPDLV